MKYVRVGSKTWRMSDMRYRQMLEIIASGGAVDLDKIGKLLVALDVSKLTPEEASDLLEGSSKTLGELLRG